MASLVHLQLIGFWLNIAEPDSAWASWREEGFHTVFSLVSLLLTAHVGEVRSLAALPEATEM